MTSPHRSRSAGGKAVDWISSVPSSKPLTIEDMEKAFEAMKSQRIQPHYEIMTFAEYDKRIRLLLRPLRKREPKKGMG